MDNKTTVDLISRRYLSPLLAYRIVYIIFCSVLCFLQIQKISKIFFSYEVTTNVYYENVLSVTVPAITLCMHKSYLLRAKHISKLGVNHSEKQIEDYLNNKTIGDQLKELLSGEEFFGEDCLIMRPYVLNETHEEYVPCKQIAPIRTSVDYHNICFTLFSQFNEEPTDRYTFDFDVSIKNYFLEIISFRITVNVSEVHFFIHSRRDRISDSFDYNHIKLLYEFGTKSCIKYHTTEIHLLAKPYSTACVDYNGIGYHSVLDCILQCKIRSLKKMFKGWPGNYLSFNSTDDKMVDILKIMGDNSSLDFKLGKECRKECGYNSDCYKEYFNFFEVKVPNNSETGFVVNIFSPDFPNLIYTNSPKMGTEEVLCYVASIVSVWFGFSFLAMSERIITGATIFAKFIQNYKQTQNINNVFVVKNNFNTKDRRLRGYRSDFHKSILDYDKH